MSNRLASHFGLKDPRFQSLVFPQITVTTLADAATTLTPAQVLGGMLIQPAGAARTDTLPTASLLADAVQGAMVGTAFEFTFRNTASGANTITVAAGAGGTTSGAMTIAQNNTKRFMVVFTNVTPGSEAYTVYSIGTFVH